MPRRECIDLVVSGCDFSGTTTQLGGMMDYLASEGYKVRDLRGNEREAMFHCEEMSDFNRDYTSLGDFLQREPTPGLKEKAKEKLDSLARITDFRISSMVKNGITEYIDPDSADVWVMEEPTRRGAGQTVRGFELYRSQFGSEMDSIAAALAHQAYRSEEFFRFRKILREQAKIILRSRSEESACYQIYNQENLPQGIERSRYLELPGHKIAFANPPTHIFLAVGPADWTPEQYATLKGQRSGNRILDDNEKNIEYQVMVNKRYATEWIDNLYKEGCAESRAKTPEITRFDIYHSKEQIIQEMNEKLKEILSER